MLVYEKDGPIATISLNRPDKLNAINIEMMDAMLHALEEADHDDEIKVVVITGRGRAFSAGHDLNEEVQEKYESALDWQRVAARDVDFTLKLWSFGKPTIAAVRGYCLAGGLDVALACDMVVATSDATFGMPEILYGSGPSSLLLPFVIGAKQTAELLLTGSNIDAEKALSWGLINQVVAPDDLQDVVRVLALRMAPTPLEVLRLTKRALLQVAAAKGFHVAAASNVDATAILNSADTPEQRMFDKIASESGMGAALSWRNSRYSQS